MLDIFDLLNSATNEKDPTYSCILLEKGALISGNKKLATFVPYENEKEMIVSAKLLGRALKSTKGGEIVYTTREHDGMTIDGLVLKKGKREIGIDGADKDIFAKTGVLGDKEPEPDWIEIGPEFTDCFKFLSDAMSQDESRGWSLSIALHDKKLMTTDTKSFFFVKVETEGSVVFPEEIVDYIINCKGAENPTHFGIGEKHVSFKFESGVIVTCQRNTDERQEQMAGICNKLFVEPTFEISEDFHEAVEAASEFASYVVILESDKIYSTSEGAYFNEEIETGVPDGIEDMSFDKKRVLLLFKDAKKIGYNEIVGCVQKSENVYAMISQRRSVNEESA